MNHPTRNTNDSQYGTNKFISKDPYATWTAATSKSFEPSRHYRSASGYPSGPDYVSSSRRNGEKLSPPGPDYKVRNDVNENQHFLPPPQGRHRDSAFPEPTYSRSHRKEISAESAPTASASKLYVPGDPSAYRHNYTSEDFAQSQPAKYEQWIPPPTQHSPSSQQERRNKERDKYEREKEKEKQGSREERHRERRDQNDAREKHKRRENGRENEGESDWDRDKERRERRDKERNRERERERAKVHDREKAREGYAEWPKERSERDNARGAERYRDEREKEKYMEIERQRTAERDREKERERERRRQERDKERERERQERKERERTTDSRLKTDVERDRENEKRREREKERESRREREYRREIESGRESDRDPDRRRRKAGWEQGKESSRKPAARQEAPVANYEGGRRDTDYEESRKTQDAVRRHKTVNTGSIPLVIKDQEVEKVRASRKDTSNLRPTKEHEKVQKIGDESEAERVRYSDKENGARREYKAHDKAKRSGGSRSYAADRVTDSEMENPLHRDVQSSIPFARESVLRTSVEPDTIIPKPSAVPYTHQAQSRDDKGPSVAPTISMIHSSNGGKPAASMALSSENTKEAASNDGHSVYGYNAPLPRPIEPISSVTPKYSPISAVSAGGESPKLDSSGQEVRTKQAQRTLKRQSRMINLVPEQITILPPSNTINKNILSQDVSQLQADVVTHPLPLSHNPRPGKDITRFQTIVEEEQPLPSINFVLPTKPDTGTATHPLLLSHNPRPGKDITRFQTIVEEEQLLPPINSVLPTKTDTGTAPSSAPTHSTTHAPLNYATGRAPTRDPLGFSQSAYDKRGPEVPQQVPKNLLGGTLSVEAPLPMGKVANNLSYQEAVPENLTSRPAVNGLGAPTSTSSVALAPPPALSTERAAPNTNAKHGTSGTGNPPTTNDIPPPRRPYATRDPLGFSQSAYDKRGPEAPQQVPKNLLGGTPSVEAPLPMGKVANNLSYQEAVPENLTSRPAINELGASTSTSSVALAPPPVLSTERPASNASAKHGTSGIGNSPTTNDIPPPRRPYSTRDSLGVSQSAYDKRGPEALQQAPKNLLGGAPSIETSLPMGKVANNLSYQEAVPENLASRPAVNGLGVSTFTPSAALAPPPALSTERVASNTSAKHGTSGTGNPPTTNDIPPPRRPYSTLGGPSLQERSESTKDKVTPVSATPSYIANPTAPPPSVDHSTSVEGQYVNETNDSQHPPIRRPATGTSEPKQEGLLPRSHTKAPISENSGMLTSNRPVSRVHMVPASQRVVAPVVEKRVLTEPRVVSRSVGDSVGATSSIVAKSKSGKSGRGESGRSGGIIVEPHHTSYSAKPEAALRSLISQHKDHPAEDPMRSEAHQQYSPGTSSRRDAPMQPSFTKGPNTADTSAVPLTVHSRTQVSNHGLTQPSPRRSPEGLVAVIPHTPPSRLTEEKKYVIPPLERGIEQSNVSMSRDQAREKRERLLDIGQLAEQAPAISAIVSTSAGVPSDGALITPQHATVRSQHLVSSALHEVDIARKEYKDNNTGKKQHSSNKDYAQPGSREEHGSHRLSMGVPRPPADNKLSVHHEGLAKVLDQPVGKTGVSSIMHAPQLSLPVTEPQAAVSEVEIRHPSSGTPKVVLQSSPSLTVHDAPSPIVGVQSKPDINQENSPKTRPTESPSRYPQSVYRSSTLYPTTSNTIPPSSTDYPKYYTSSSHTPPNHPHANSSPLPALQSSQSRDSPSSYQVNVGRETMPTAYSQRPLPDATEINNPSSFNYNTIPNRSQPKDLDSAIQKSVRPESSQMQQFKPPTAPSFRSLEPQNHFAANQHMARSEVNSRIVEPGPIPAASASLLFSKGTTQVSPHMPLEQKDNDYRAPFSDHATRGVEHVYTSLSTTQDFEKHEPRLITPKAHKPPELQEEPQIKPVLADNAKPRPPEWYQETHKKSTSLDGTRVKTTSYEQTRPPEVWYPPPPSREDERDRTIRRRRVSISAKEIPTVLRTEQNPSTAFPLDEEAEQAKLAEGVANVINMRVYPYLREKRNRTISILSTEAQDGTSSTIMGSPTASVLSQPPIHVPLPRDPMRAAHDWLSESLDAAMRGQSSGRRRILRPGVVFDVAEDPPSEERRHRLRSTRFSKAPPSNLKGT